MKAIDIKTAKTAELVAFYNEHTGKSIKKFSSRAAGEKQVAAILAKMPIAKASSKKEAAPKADEHKNRSAGIAKSWKDPEVAAKRAQRTNVKVGSHFYRSVKEAFEANNLPLSKHIRFRIELKQHAQLTFEHEGKSYTFNVVEGE